MKLTILGSGVAIPGKRNKNCSSYLLENDGIQLVLDFGRGAFQSLFEAGIDYNEIDTFYISHPHPDHYADLVPFFQACKLTRHKPITFFGFSGLSSLIQQIKALPGVTGKNEAYQFIVHEFEPGDTFSISSLACSFFEMKHQGLNALGIRIVNPSNNIFAYTGDTAINENLHPLALNADCFVTECSFTQDDQRYPGHITPIEIAQTAAQAMVKKIVLSHIYPFTDSERVVREVKKLFAGEVVSAYEGLSLTF